MGFQLALEQTTTYNEDISLEDMSGLLILNGTDALSTNAGDNVSMEDETLNGAVILENLADTGLPEYIIQEEYVVGDMSRETTAQNELFDQLDDTILDFTEKNPFGDAGTKG